MTPLLVYAMSLALTFHTVSALMLRDTLSLLSRPVFDTPTPRFGLHHSNAYRQTWSLNILGVEYAGMTIASLINNPFLYLFSESHLLIPFEHFAAVPFSQLGKIILCLANCKLIGPFFLHTCKALPVPL